MQNSPQQGISQTIACIIYFSLDIKLVTYNGYKCVVLC